MRLFSNNSLFSFMVSYHFPEIKNNYYRHLNFLILKFNKFVVKLLVVKFNLIIQLIGKDVNGRLGSLGSGVGGSGFTWVAP